MCYTLFKYSNGLREGSAVMDLMKEIGNLAMNFEACHKTLAAIANMDRVDYSILLPEIEHH